MVDWPGRSEVRKVPCNAAIWTSAGIRRRWLRPLRKRGDPAAHRRSLRGLDADGRESARPGNGMDVRGAEFGRTAHSEPDGDRLVPRGRELGQTTPPS